MTTTETIYKVNDVFSFRYNEEESKKRAYPYHCFDGQFIVRQKDNGELYLVDTYWASKHDNFKYCSESKTKTIEEALKQGYLKFKCNLDEVEEIREHEQCYYADEDIFNLSYQSNCYKYFVKRKGAERSKQKMLKSIKQKIADTENEIRYATNNLKSYNEKLLLIESGDLTIYL